MTPLEALEAIVDLLDSPRGCEPFVVGQAMRIAEDAIARAQHELKDTANLVKE